MRKIIASGKEWGLQPLNFFLATLALVPIFLVIIFAFIHRQDFPRNEEYLYTMPIVAEYQDNGRIDPALFFVRVGELHVTFFPLLVTFLSFLVADWSVDFEIAVIFVAVLLTYLMLIGLFYRSEPKALPFILVPFSMLLFSVHQDVNWYMGYYAATWHLPGFFFVLGLSLIEWFPDRWWSLIAAAIASLCAMLSLSPGILSWLLIGVYLPFSGHRKRYYYLFWFIVSSSAITLYALDPIRRALFESETRTAVAIYDLSQQIKYVFVRLGAGFVSRWWVGDYFDTRTLAFGLGLFGLVLTGVNLAVIWQRHGSFRSAARWLALAGYGFGTAVLLAINPGRSSQTFGYFLSWYDTAIGMFWIASTASIVLTVWSLVKTNPPQKFWSNGLLYGNLAVSVILIAFYVIQNQRIQVSNATSDYPDNWATGPPVTDECAAHYVFTLEEGCLPYHVSLANQLAARRLAVYARLEPMNIMPQEYQPGDWVIVETDTAWGSVHARDWVLDGIASDHLIFVFPADKTDFGEMLHPPEPWLDSHSEQVENQLLDLIGTAERVWIVRPDQTPSLDEIDTALNVNSYSKVDAISSEWIITRFERSS